MTRRTSVRVDGADWARGARSSVRARARQPRSRRTQRWPPPRKPFARASAEILEANAQDMAAARERDLSSALLDRLLLDEKRVAGIARAIEEVHRPARSRSAPSLAEWERPNGLRIQRVRVPLGVIGIIYESRPNVTADAGALCLKSGNAVILRGGSESAHSSRAIHACLVAGSARGGLA